MAGIPLPAPWLYTDDSRAIEGAPSVTDWISVSRYSCGVRDGFRNSFSTLLFYCTVAPEDCSPAEMSVILNMVTSSSFVVLW